MKNYTRYFTLSLLILSSAICHAALQNGKVQVATTKGESSLTDPKSVKELVVSGKLFEQGYKVETNKEATVELCLSNGSTLLLNPETLIEVRTFRQVASNLIAEGAYQKLDKEPSPSVVEIFVVRGKIIGEVRKLNPQSSFTIKTAAGVARIRGTVYTVEYSENKSTRTGSMEVSCVKGSVEVTINGSNTGPAPVDPGKKVTAQTPLVDESDSNPNEAVKKAETKLASNDQKTITLKDSEGLKPGAKIKGAGLPDDIEIVSVDPVSHVVTLNKPITVEAGVEITVVREIKPNDGPQKVETKIATKDQPTIVLLDSEGLKPGMKIKGAGLPDDIEIVSVDPVSHVVTLNKPITVEAGVEITPVRDFEPAPFITPTIIFGKLDPSEISKISDNLSSGTGLPPKLIDDIKQTADNPPPPPSTPPPSNSPGPDSKKDVLDDLTKTIQETIEKENQNNPSPTGG